MRFRRLARRGNFQTCSLVLLALSFAAKVDAGGTGVPTSSIHDGISTHITLPNPNADDRVAAASAPPCALAQGTGQFVATIPSFKSTQYQNPNGNLVVVQTCGFAVDPVAVGDPSNNYYIFDIQVTATAASGWSVDSGGLLDPYGPTLVVTAYPVCPNCLIETSQIWPDAAGVSRPGGVSIKASVGVTYHGVSAGISFTWTPPRA